MFDVYLKENPLILKGVELKIIEDNFNRRKKVLIENHFLKYKSNKFYIEKNMLNKFMETKKQKYRRLINIEIDYLEDIKLCKLTHKIEMPEEEFIKMIGEDDKDFEIKLKEIEKN
ncbi:unnamed protein product [Meloidogyne enterolobii]|uniref:Uncharacterized protein n=1 Tax=Meloidogyne enterolobii TaxID=390850 RepID=A0ACB0XT74_MELEN